MAAQSQSERTWLLLQEFRAALEEEARARQAWRGDPRNPELLNAWMRAMDATHEASRRMREGSRDE